MNHITDKRTDLSDRLPSTVGPLSEVLWHKLMVYSCENAVKKNKEEEKKKERDHAIQLYPNHPQTLSKHFMHFFFFFTANQFVTKIQKRALRVTLIHHMPM